MQKEIIEYLKNKEKPYELKSSNMIVEFEYSDNGKKINDCIKNIIIQKSKNN